MSQDPIQSIFHEKQEGSLCAQHCLNALLQGNFFTAVDLADLARQLDDSERRHMAEAGEDSAEYQRFLKQPSNNFDDSGFFSIQVLQNALAVWNLELLSYRNPNSIAEAARNDSRSQQAYICNFREHWFTVRKLGNQWFNLNSLLTGPELISDTYLSMFLTQLEKEGYSIFIVIGQFNECEADQLLRLIPAVQGVKPRLISESGKQSAAGSSKESGLNFQDEDLRKALEESRRFHDEEDETLKQALAMSMQGLPADWGLPSDSAWMQSQPTSQGDEGSKPSTSAASETVAADADEVRRKRMEFFNKSSEDKANSDSHANEFPAGTSEPTCPVNKETTPSCEDRIPNTSDSPSDVAEDDEDLQKAISLSMSAT